MKKKQFTTIMDVARRAGVSTSTVSHVLNGTRRVTDKTRKKVEAAIKELNYMPNELAKNLRGSSQLSAIGLLLPDMNNTFYMELARHFEHIAFEKGVRIIACNTDYDQDREREYIDDLIRRRVDGIIIAPAITDTASMDFLKDIGFPVVLVDRVPIHGKLHTVSADNRAGGSLVAGHLYNIGHRRIGCITYQTGLAESADQRIVGFVETLKALGSPVPDSNIVFADFKVSGGFNAAYKLLSGNPGLTALFCTNDLMAVGAIRAATSLSLSVPDQLSIVGFDNSLVAKISLPPLTTVSQPVEDLAVRAMDLLDSSVNDIDSPDSITPTLLDVQLIIRESTAPPREDIRKESEEGRTLAGSRTGVGAPSVKTEGTSRVRVAVIGAGRIGQVHAGNLCRRVSGVEVVSVCDIDGSKATVLADKYAIPHATDDVDHVFERGDIDAVIIGSSSDSHFALVQQAAAAGINIFCEKPLALSEDDILDAISICEHAGVLLQVGFNRRFDPNVEEIVRSVRSGKIGKVYTLRLTSREPWPPTPDYVRHSGGMFLDMSIHDFDLARYVLGDEVVEVSVTGGCLIDPAIGAEGDVDVATISLRFESGVIGVIENTRATPFGYDQRLEVFGSDGALESENITPSRVVLRYDGGQQYPNPLPFFLERYEIAFSKELQVFIDALRNGVDPDPKVTGLDALRAHEIATAARQSLQVKKAVEVQRHDTNVPEMKGGIEG